MTQARKCGVLLPVASLPGRFGIGCFSREAYRFIDFLEKAGQTYWQILPLGQTGYGDSPYQSFSTFAGNPYFIDLEGLIKEGYLSEREAKRADLSSESGAVDYGKLYFHRYPLLRRAYMNSPFCLNPRGKFADERYDAERAEMEAFRAANAYWLDDYALFCALKEAHGGASYLTWEDDIRLRRKAALNRARKAYAEDVRFYEFLQFFFWRQWHALKRYANEKGIRIFGDLPIYVALDSSDTWSHPELFDFDADGRPTVVAGCPPDAFSATGQLWGNPIYNWSYHKKTGYAWWLKRLAATFDLYDVVRIDHFRGFDEYYAIPYGDTTAERGTWRPGPGIDLFRTMEKKLGRQAIIAEDLGYLTPSVHKLLADTGFPGMKVLQFAFDAGADNAYLPHNHVENACVYTGTHDNQTSRGWYASAGEYTRNFATRYMGIPNEKAAASCFIRTALMSVCSTAIIPMQDYLNLDDRARINTPSTLGGNWLWRMNAKVLTDGLAREMRDLAVCYDRVR